MIFLIALVVPTIIVIIYDFIKYGYLDDETTWKSFISTVASLGAAFVIFLTSFCWCPTTCVSVETQEIYALIDSSSVERHAYLARSYDEENLKYNYLYQKEGKGWGYRSVEAESCYINFTLDTPHVEIHNIDYKYAFFRWLFPDFIADDYIFYIPEDSVIINDYEIDLN